MSTEYACMHKSSAHERTITLSAKLMHADANLQTLQQQFSLVVRVDAGRRNEGVVGVGQRPPLPRGGDLRHRPGCNACES
jgi:hypothetical protein